MICMVSFGQVKVEYTDLSHLDFSFAQDWNYPEWVYVNCYGQVSCDGWCPERTWSMKDSTGKIFQDSLAVFYSLVDTAHQHYTLYGEANMYEYAGTDYMDCRMSGDSIYAETRMGIATHSYLEIVIFGGWCGGVVNFISITDIPPTSFELVSGFFRLDTNALANGILKGQFHFQFYNHLNPRNELWWKGVILSPIKHEED